MHRDGMPAKVRSLRKLQKLVFWRKNETAAMHADWVARAPVFAGLLMPLINEAGYEIKGQGYQRTTGTRKGIRRGNEILQKRLEGKQEAE